MKKGFFIFLLLPIININTASPTQLDQLAGIGPVMAQRIIDARPFSSVDDLDRVKGIGPATLQKIKEQGFACVDCQSLSSSASSKPKSSSSASSAKPKILPNSEKSVNSNGIEAGLTVQNNSPWVLFFAVLAVTLILAAAVLFIKLKLNNHVRT